jgi:hypothetical protein
MDYRDTLHYGDFKYFWELGRFQHLITLAKAYYLTKEEKYAREAAIQIRSFVEQCPYLLGVQWTMPMELGIRLISLVWIVAFMSDYLKEDAETCGFIEQIVRSHVEYTAANYSGFSSANNHLIGEVTGVFLASLCFEGIGGMTRYKRQSHRMLCEEIGRQFYSDGVNREQTTHYHISCYNCFLLAGLLGKANGMDFPEAYWQRLEKAAEFVSALYDGPGSVPHIGDSDDGRTIVLADEDYDAAQSLLATAAVLFNREDFKAKAGYFDEMSFWLLGPEGQTKFDEMGLGVQPADAVAFREGGYYVMKSDGPANVRIVFDCGPLGFGALAGHGHADALSFTLRAYGRDFLVDPGTYIYEAKNPYRNYFRSTAAHNTVQIDGWNQSEMIGPFMWGRKANSCVEEWHIGGGVIRVSGRHDGYSRLNDPVIHKRTVELNKASETVSVIDTVESRASHAAVLYFHFAPECEVRRRSGNCWEIDNSGCKIVLSTEARLGCSLHRGEEDPICGWASRRYDCKTPSFTLACRLVTQGKNQIVTRISVEPCPDSVLGES